MLFKSIYQVMLRLSSIYTICLLCVSLTGYTQSPCPPNIDFEEGSFNNWLCRSGYVSATTAGNTITWTATGPMTYKHTIISSADTTRDAYGGFPQKGPGGGQYSVKLGGPTNGAEAEGIFYSYTIPDTATIFSILFYYAVVFQNPGHSPEQQPRFRARIFNETDNEFIDCANFDFTASASLPGFNVSPYDPTVLYKEWTPVTLNLTGYAGKTIQLEFITSDCTLSGHFGYAYVDVNSNCSGLVSGSAVCRNEISATLTAPFGFETYTWYSDFTFSTILSNSQTLTLTPSPTPGSIFPVVITPYAGFGCPDTIKALISLAPQPFAVAGPDGPICPLQQRQLGGIPSDDLIYNWEPPALVSDPTIANPFTPFNLTAPVTYYLTVISKTTGCKAYDTVTVNPVTIDTSLVFSGDTAFCRGDNINLAFEVLDTEGSIQWFKDGVAVTGATGNHYNPVPSESSIYWATITKSNCFVYTRQIRVKIEPRPKADFILDGKMKCLNIPVKFMNNSSGNDLDFIWKLSDGTIANDKDLTKTFTNAGNYEISLKAISSAGCLDSITKVIEVIENCNVYVPSGFSPNHDGINDVFKPFSYGIKKLHRFSVYDRTGNLIYTTKTNGQGWDGTYKGAVMASSVFVWLLEYDSEEQKNIILKGTVILIR